MKNLIYIFLLLTFLLSCKQEVKEDPNVFYTCSMDPQVMEKKPGKCPICGMQLTKTIVTPGSSNKSIKLSETQLQLANIKTSEVEYSLIGEGLSLRGTVVPNEKNSAVITSRIAGRVDKLYFKNEGEKIKKGDRVYDIYSEELQEAIRQYLLVSAKANQLEEGNVNYQQMLVATKHKLIIWGVTENQISNFKESSANAVVPYYSPEDGVVTKVLIEEGDYVEIGSPVVNVDNYSTLWVEAEAYPSDMNDITIGTKVKVVVEAFPNEEMEGEVGFQNPELNPQSKIDLVKVEIPNKEGKYKPGMRATINVISKQKKAITVPEEAVLYQPGMNVVWTEDTSGAFAPRMVETGIKSKGRLEVTSGLATGDVVVISGVYLLNSEYQLRNGSAMEAMPGMEHNHKAGDMKDMPGM